MVSITRNLDVDAVLIQKAAKARAVNNPGLEQEPRAFRRRTACLKSQSNQGRDHNAKILATRACESHR